MSAADAWSESVFFIFLWCHSCGSINYFICFPLYIHVSLSWSCSYISVLIDLWCHQLTVYLVPKSWVVHGPFCVLQFSSWAVLFSSSHPFVPYLLSWGPFLMLTITIFLSWDSSHSLYMPSNPYTIPCITARQGIPFVYCFLVMDTYSSSRLSRIGCVLLLLILFSMTFHDLLFLLSGTFYLVPPCSFTYSADLFWSI